MYGLERKEHEPRTVTLWQMKLEERWAVGLDKEERRGIGVAGVRAGHVIVRRSRRKCPPTVEDGSLHTLTVRVPTGAAHNTHPHTRLSPVLVSLLLDAI